MTTTSAMFDHGFAVGMRKQAAGGAYVRAYPHAERNRAIAHGLGGAVIGAVSALALAELLRRRRLSASSSKKPRRERA